MKIMNVEAIYLKIPDLNADLCDGLKALIYEGPGKRRSLSRSPLLFVCWLLELSAEERCLSWGKARSVYVRCKQRKQTNKACTFRRASGRYMPC